MLSEIHNAGRGAAHARYGVDDSDWSPDLGRGGAPDEEDDYANKYVENEYEYQNYEISSDPSMVEAGAAGAAVARFHLDPPRRPYIVPDSNGTKGVSKEYKEFILKKLEKEKKASHRIPAGTSRVI